MTLNEIIYTLQCEEGRVISRPLRLYIADVLTDLWDKNKALQTDNNRLRTALAYMKETQVTPHCENCESSAKKIEELQEQLEAAVSNIPKVCATCKFRDDTGEVFRIHRCERCYFHDVPEWEWNGKKK